MRHHVHLGLILLIAGGARTSDADDDPPRAANDEPATLDDPGDLGASPAPADPAAPATDPAAATDARRGEVIELTGKAPAAAGVISVDAGVARKTAGALGEPFRVIALLPGVTTSIAASGYPIIRGTLPGESRFLFDGIELPMLYHLLLGNQVVHPAFLGELELRAGGYGAEHGQMLGGLIAMTPAAQTDRTELHLNLVETGVFRSQRLSGTTSIAAGARIGTLAALVAVFKSSATLHYVDQQIRLVHRLGNGDELTLTSLGAFDYVKLPPTPDVRTVELGFHRLDARWSRARPGGKLRAGIQTEFDTLRSVLTFAEPMPTRFPPDSEPPPPTPPPDRQGGRSYGVRAYADGSVRLGDWLTARAGIEAHHRSLVNRAPRFSLSHADDPFLGVARAVDSEAAWSAVDLRVGPFTITPGIRVDGTQVDMPDVSVRHADVDPRLAITAELPGGGLVELAGGRYSAPPQASVISGPIAIGPLPMAEGAASTAGLSHGFQAQASLRMPLAGGWQGNLAAYYRDTDYAVDFGMIGKPFTNHALCDSDTTASEALVYRHIELRAMGLEAMLRRQLGRSVTGWLSYSLGKIDRDLGFVRLPHDYDQRHTLNAAVQWRYGAWLFGTSGNLHTGRPVVYPQWQVCSLGNVDGLDDPTHLRRLPTTWRVDLRAERAFRFSGWNLHLYFEMQNASLTKEVLGYQFMSDEFGPPNYRVGERTLFIAVPILGIEAEL